VRRLLLLPLLALAIRTHAEDSNPECDAGSTGGIEKNAGGLRPSRGRDVSRCRSAWTASSAVPKKTRTSQRDLSNAKATTGGETAERRIAEAKGALQTARADKKRPGPFAITGR